MDRVSDSSSKYKLSVYIKKTKFKIFRNPIIEWVYVEGLKPESSQAVSNYGTNDHDINPLIQPSLLESGGEAVERINYIHMRTAISER